MRILPTLLSLLIFGSESFGTQSPNAPSARDTVERLSRIDTNRAADLQIIRGNQNNAVRQAILKQISQDFRDLQSVNNSMMAEAWSEATLDYRNLSKMIRELQKKASRLKSNLALPRSSDEAEKPVSKVDISTEKELRVELLTLDRFVMRFVRNPIFRSTNVIELEAATQASRDLEQIIKRCSVVKKASSQLQKSAKSKE